MIKRIVQMEFEAGMASYFLNDILPNQKHFTRNFPGCSYLELWQDIHNPNIVMSFSYWESEAELNAYRSSEKFRAFWKATKAGFSTPARAWSVQVLEVVPKS